MKRSKKNSLRQSTIKYELLEPRAMLAGCIGVLETELVGSRFAYVGESCRLIMPQDELGNRIPDFSAAGDRNSNESLPDTDQLFSTSQVVDLSPVEGDNTSHVQSAIDQVESFPLDANGFRGMVRLSPGEFRISGALSILASGVVLRGAGQGDNPEVDTFCARPVQMTARC